MEFRDDSNDTVTTSVWSKSSNCLNLIVVAAERAIREVIVAFDFFTVPTLTFQLLCCFFVIDHGRRRILHFNVTRHPSAEWVVQQHRQIEVWSTVRRRSAMVLQRRAS